MKSGQISYLFGDERGGPVGVSDGMIRLSCGIEDAGDLIADLKQALG